MIIKAVSRLGCRAVISCVPELDPGDAGKISLDIRSDVDGASSLPPDTVYIIQTSGSTGGLERITSMVIISLKCRPCKDCVRDQLQHSAQHSEYLRALAAVHLRSRPHVFPSHI